eukprot:3737116-Pyramimonas_sp.AAC.1
MNGKRVKGRSWAIICSIIAIKRKIDELRERAHTQAKPARGHAQPELSQAYSGLSYSLLHMRTTAERTTG